MRDRFRILVIGDPGLLRDGICGLLAIEGYSEIVGAADAITSLDRLSLGQAPDLVVLDVSAAARTWKPHAAAIRNRWPGARMIVLTPGREGEADAHDVAPDADARFSKSHGGRQLIDTVRAVLQTAAQRTDSSSSQPSTPDLARRFGVRQHGTDALSDREREVMKQIARGFRTREIALQLSLSQKTIEKHRSNLMRKLGLRTATAVAAYAIANGYVEPP